MSTTFWLPSDTTAPVSPTPNASDWAHANSVSRELHTTRASSALATVSYAPDGADHLVASGSMIAQFVSALLPAQTVPVQDVGLSVLCLEANAANNQLLAWKLYAVDTAGTSVLGTFLALGTVSGEIATSQDGKVSVRAISQVILAVPWRLVLEVGTSGTPAAGGNHNASIRFGVGTYSGSGVQNGDNGDFAPQLVFQNDLQFRSLPAVGDVQEAVTYGVPGSELTGTLALPDEDEVEDGVGFGAAGTEFEGTLAAGGGGGSSLTDIT